MKIFFIIMVLCSFSVGYGKNKQNSKMTNQKIENFELKENKEMEKFLLEELKKGNNDVYGFLAGLYIKNNDIKKAKEILLEGTEKVQDKEVVKKIKLSLGILYIKENNKKEAEKILRSIKNSDKYVFKNLGNMYFVNEDYEKAIEYFEKALKKGDEISIQAIVNSYGQLGKINSEEKGIVKREYEKGNIYSYGFYGLTFINNSETIKEGEKICKLGIEKGDPSSYLCMSLIYELQGNEKEAERMNEKYMIETFKVQSKLNEELEK